jgi:excisionase family DNA binding protein
VTGVLTVPEAAAELRCSVRFVLDELRRKNLRGSKTGAGWRIDPADIRTYLDAHANVTRVKRVAS